MYLIQTCEEIELTTSFFIGLGGRGLTNGQTDVAKILLLGSIFTLSCLDAH